MHKDYELVSFLLAGKRRRKVLEALKEPKMPKQLAIELGLSISNISNTLPELVEKGLVECKNPKSHLYKFYARTKKGEEALKSL